MYEEPHNYRTDDNYNRLHSQFWYQKTYEKMDVLDTLEYIDRFGLAIIPEFMVCPNLRAAFVNYLPKMMPPPPDDDKNGYITPSYLMWHNENSFISFSGSTEIVELPRDILTKTTGHPRIRPEQMRIERSRLPIYGWEPQSMFDLDRRDKRLFR